MDSCREPKLFAMDLISTVDAIQGPTAAFQIGRQFRKRGAEKAHGILSKDKQLTTRSGFIWEMAKELVIP